MLKDLTAMDGDGGYNKHRPRYGFIKILEVFLSDFVIGCCLRIDLMNKITFLDKNLFL